MCQSQGPKVKQKKFSFHFIYYLTKHIYIKLMWHERYPKDTDTNTHACFMEFHFNLKEI